MVTFEIKNHSSNKISYKYYPENDKKYKCGIFTIFLDSQDVEINTVAEKDYLCTAPKEELNYLRDAINNSRIENGELPITDEELPFAQEDENWYKYADQAIKRVKEELQKGNIPKYGESVWY